MDGEPIYLNILQMQQLRKMSISRPNVFDRCSVCLNKRPGLNSSDLLIMQFVSAMIHAPSKISKKIMNIVFNQFQKLKP